MEEGYLALRWNNHHVIFTRKMNLLREQESYTDVSLACGGRLYPAHRFVLSTCSDYFKEIFSKTPCAHPVVFLKDVSGKDIESLLDFMYKGEVHVPQSELGSLLRVAEGLQVKGLAVPDDTVRTRPRPPPLGTTAAITTTPTSPEAKNSSSSSSTQSNKKNFNAAAAAASSSSSNKFSLKRKRLSSSEKKDDPPRLMPRPRLSGQTSKRNLTKSKGRTLSMPELKKIKLEEIKIRNNINNNLIARNDEGIRAILESHPSSSPPPLPLPPSSSSCGDHLTTNCEEEDETSPQSCSALALPPQFKMDRHEEDPMTPDDQNGEESGDDEYEDAGGDDGSSRNVATIKSELEDYDSLPNSDIATSELLQVDLSEDGTQFIIASGVLGGDASRGSSAEGEESAEKKPFVCLLCGHTFTRRDNLANHLKTHTGDKPFMCQYCHKCFSRKDYLKQHERIHTGEKPYPCEICGRAFTRKEGLTDHMRCHSDFKEFSCETCGKSFKQKCGLRFHKRNYKH